MLSCALARRLVSFRLSDSRSGRVRVAGQGLGECGCSRRVRLGDTSPTVGMIRWWMQQPERTVGGDWGTQGQASWSGHSGSVVALGR